MVILWYKIEVLMDKISFKIQYRNRFNLREMPNQFWENKLYSFFHFYEFALHKYISTSKSIFERLKVAIKSNKNKHRQRL